MADDADDNLEIKFLGCVLGAAVGDALAFPYQHYSRQFLRSISSPLTDGFAEHHTSSYPSGQYSDDTQMLLALLKAIAGAAAEAAELNVPFVLRHLLPLWRDQMLVERDPSCAEAMARVLGSGESQPRPLEEGRAEASPTGRAVAVALWYHRHPDEMHERVEAMVRLTHTDRRTLACAAAVAAMIEHNLTTTEIILGDFLDKTAAACARFDERIAEAILDFPRILSMAENRCHRHLEAVCEDRRYPMSDEGLSEYAVPTMLFALHSFLKSPHRYEDTVDRCLRLGGQVDTATFLAGAISGAHLGSDAIPANLRNGLHGGAELKHATENFHRLWLAGPGANRAE